MPSSIELDHVSRTFKGQRGAPDVEALTDISLSIERGEFFGILGPNGAGKTTLVRILATLLTPTAGGAYINGVDVAKEPNDVRRSIGVVFGGERGLYDRLSAKDNLRFAAELYGVGRRQQNRIIPELLEKVGLNDVASARVETFSRGMKQRLHIARALVHDPDLILLDEPSAGLDPIAARSLRDLTRELNSAGRTIVLTTHYMFEADELCNRLVVIADGAIVREGTPDEVKSSVRLGRVLEIDVYGDTSTVLEVIRAREDILYAESDEQVGFSRVTMRLPDTSPLTLPEVLPLFGELSLGRAVDRGPTLEDAYVAIIEEAR